ncbi:hypothetical protein AVDCRST_MAG81-52 [uncultured Synechococcales cyanobacterium]|uniref:Uncharacterized protein n=1 Tax=uncultured Synechococcales cyanobacterium TaxID=1936017 RepID=A0A6J4UQJ2_9CYAN|nr:hypothetical protein AVDCRST_MAG81-52 [uncultured Synechococcales cyanobacterium]
MKKRQLLTTALAVSSLIGTAFGARAQLPESNPNCNQHSTKATVYGHTYQVPAFFCLDSDYSKSIVVDISNLTSNREAVTAVSAPKGTSKIFIRYQDGQTQQWLFEGQTLFPTRYQY